MKRWKFALIDKMTKFSFIAFLTQVSKFLGYFTPSALKPSGLRVIDLTLVTWVN
jgi:hypothetical protein